MNRHAIAGVAVAGALSLWAGGTVVAADDPADTVLHTAHGFAAAASEKVSGCAETQITSFEAAVPPQGVTGDARDQAVETANEKVIALTEAAQTAIWAQFETFAETVDQADEAGASLPNAAALADYQKAVDTLATDACSNIAKVKIEWPNPTTIKPGDTDTEQGDETERDSESKPSASHHSERVTHESPSPEKD